MKIKHNKIIVLAIISLALFSFTVLAEKHIYKGQVEGMVCAFCTYNVGKKIAAFKGVDASTVNLDLQSGEVGFVSSVVVEKAKLADVFTETGFKLLELKEVQESPLSELTFYDSPLISLSFPVENLSKIIDILDTIGQLAASQTTQLSLRAPAQMELDLLKPIIAGRQKAIKVNFQATDTNKVTLELAAVVKD